LEDIADQVATMLYELIAVVSAHPEPDNAFMTDNEQVRPGNMGHIKEYPLLLRPTNSSTELIIPSESLESPANKS
jgi:hypothetical protein